MSAARVVASFASDITQQGDLFTKDGQLGASFKEGLDCKNQLSLEAVFLPEKTSRSSVRYILMYN